VRVGGRDLTPHPPSLTGKGVASPVCNG
jgi:hypothetical protein